MEEPGDQQAVGFSGGAAEEEADADVDDQLDQLGKNLGEGK